MKATAVNYSDRMYKVLSFTAPLFTIYVFWAINAEHRFSLEPSGKRDLIDLLVITVATLLACSIVLLTDRFALPTVTAKLGLSLVLFAVLAPLSAWILYTLVFHISLAKTTFLRLDLPLAVPVFIAWASSYLLRQHLRRIEVQHESNYGRPHQRIASFPEQAA